jgi:DeoR/GlpR family transcriptional regulator of sugar metabolism
MVKVELAEERRAHILELLKQEGKVVALELSTRFEVSEDTIRRDLRELADAGLLRRVHGGALPRSPFPSGHREREGQRKSEKHALAKVAADLLQDGQMVIFGGGTTNLEIARALNPSLALTAITTSPQIALTLTNYERIEVIMIGGRMNKAEQVVADAEALRQIRGFNADLCFIGICSLHPHAGLTANVYEEVAVNQAMIAQSTDVVAVALADKLGTIAPYTVAPLTEITHLVTEAHLSEDALLPYQKTGIQILKGSSC